MQIADLTVPNEMRTAPVVSSFPAAASDFFRLLETVMRGDVGTAQALPLLADDSGVPSGGSVAPETSTDISTGLWTGAVSEAVRLGSPQALDDGRDAMALDQSGTALALALLAGMVNTAAFECLAEGPCAALAPASADVAFDPAAVSQFAEASEEAPPLASISVPADQHPLAAELQGSVGHASPLAVALSAADAISLTPARVIEEPPMGTDEEGSVRVVAPQGKPVLNDSTPLTTGGSTRLTAGSVEGAASSVVPDAQAELPLDQRLTPAGISAPVLSKAEGPALSDSAPLTTGSVEGSARQSSTAPELFVPQPAIGRGEGTVDSGLAPLTTGGSTRLTTGLIDGPVLSVVEGGRITPRRSTESAGLTMMASDETANSDDGAAAITMFHDPPDGTTTEERPQLAAQPGVLRDRPGVGQERLSSGSEDEDGSRGMTLPTPGSDRSHGGGPYSGEASSTRADASRPGASVVAERDRSLTLQVTQQIVAAARLGLREDGTSVRLRLRPESLGELLIKISWKEKGIVAAIQAESPVTARMLQEDLGHLKAALGERGITVNDLGVQVGVDLRHGRAHDDRFPATTTLWVAQDARQWLPRDEALPLASLIRREGLIDIRV